MQWAVEFTKPWVETQVEAETAKGAITLPCGLWWQSHLALCMLGPRPSWHRMSACQASLSLIFHSLKCNTTRCGACLLNDLRLLVRTLEAVFFFYYTWSFLDHLEELPILCRNWYLSWNKIKQKQTLLWNGLEFLQCVLHKLLQLVGSNWGEGAEGITNSLRQTR